MRFKKFFSLIAIIVLIISANSCVRGENDLRNKLSPWNKSLIDLASQMYNETKLWEIANFHGSIHELNSNYSIECLRETNHMYRASFLGNEAVAVLLFDGSGNKIWGNVYHTQLLASDFDIVKKGHLLNEVRTLDPKGEYLFLYTGKNDTPKTSSHYTKDGYLITIEYDASNVITNIHKEFI